MLDAWRVFTMERTWHSDGFCQPIYSMLMEEAYLRGDLLLSDFYERKADYTRCDWRGAPKGDIEPIKAIKADLLAIKGNLKTREEAIAERGGDLYATFEQLEEEQQLLSEKGLTDPDVTDNDTEEEDIPEGE